jgi:hypothetical protein
VGGLAFYRKGAPEETIDPLWEAFREIEDALDVGVAVILIPRRARSVGPERGQTWPWPSFWRTGTPFGRWWPSSTGCTTFSSP